MRNSTMLGGGVKLSRNEVDIIAPLVIVEPSWKGEKEMKGHGW